MLQSFFSDSPDPGHFTSMIRITPAGTSAMLRCPPVSINTVLPESSSRCISGYTSGCSNGSPPVTSTASAAARLDVGNDVVHAHLAAFVEGVGRVAPAAAQVAGGQAHEHARPAGMGRLALDRMEDLVNR